MYKKFYISKKSRFYTVNILKRKRKKELNSSLTFNKGERNFQDFDEFDY